MSDLRIAPGITLPLDAVTRTFGVLGQRGTGETSAAVVMAEEMVAKGYEASGGGFNNPLGKLRTLELVEGSGELRLADAFGERLT